jgi:hypothetical protein
VHAAHDFLASMSPTADDRSAISSWNETIEARSEFEAT